MQSVFISNLTAGINSGTRLASYRDTKQEQRAVKYANSILSTASGFDPLNPGGNSALPTAPTGGFLSTVFGKNHKGLQGDAAPDGSFSGATWQSAKKRYIDAISNISDPNVAAGMRQEFANMEKGRITSYLDQAITASQQGDSASAAKYLSAASYYQNPGVRSMIAPGPSGSLAVLNVDKSGKPVGAYAATTANLIDMRGRLTDFVKWEDVSFNQKLKLRQQGNRDRLTNSRLAASADARKLSEEKMRQMKIAFARGISSEDSAAIAASNNALASAKDAASIKRNKQVAAVTDAVLGSPQYKSAADPGSDPMGAQNSDLTAALGGAIGGASADKRPLNTSVDQRTLAPRRDAKGNITGDGYTTNWAVKNVATRLTSDILDSNPDMTTAEVSSAVGALMFSPTSTMTATPGPSGSVVVATDGVPVMLSTDAWSTLGPLLTPMHLDATPPAPGTTAGPVTPDVAATNVNNVPPAIAVPVSTAGPSVPTAMPTPPATSSSGLDAMLASYAANPNTGDRGAIISQLYQLEPDPNKRASVLAFLGAPQEGVLPQPVGYQPQPPAVLPQTPQPVAAQAVLPVPGGAFTQPLQAPLGSGQPLVPPSSPTAPGPGQPLPAQEAPPTALPLQSDLPPQVSDGMAQQGVRSTPRMDGAIAAYIAAPSRDNFNTMVNTIGQDIGSPGNRRAVQVVLDYVQPR